MQTETTDKVTTRVIDPSQIGNNTEMVAVDATANAFNKPNPLPDGKYRAQLSKPTNEEDLKNLVREITWKGDDGQTHTDYTVTYELKIMEPAIPVPGLNAETLQGRKRTFKESAGTFERSDNGKKTNELATLLVMLGATLPPTVSKGDLVRTFIQALETKPTIGVETELVAEYDTGVVNEKSKPNKEGKKSNVWKTAFRGEHNFPKNTDGSINYDPTFQGKNVFVKSTIKNFFRAA